ncbi:6-phosphogluconolactonase [Sphingomonas gellani]|uniref:6-phosphogluconolactonase n=1 Tax=Sphingomonas gellani TaxID=1166340 RepID=A0A1H8AWF5_9SPHN|nr:beta-propeller fold lactonase family protein [Sphingomonas gellani]SEM75072.1 6-phosphogluconolactonase [Sphingomonas gellani]
MSSSDAPQLAPTRRLVIGGALAIGLSPVATAGGRRDTLIAGSYTREGGPGLLTLAHSARGWRRIALADGIRNASFGVCSVTGLRYLVDEQEHGAIGIYDRDLRRLAVLPTLGADPCHVALRGDGGALAVANYSSGTVTHWRLDPATGLPIGQPQSISHAGYAPAGGVQAPHAHWVGWVADGSLLHSVDLGADAILAHDIDPGTGRCRATAIAYRAPAGSGPRHLVRNPHRPVAYLISELSNTVTLLDAQADGTFSARAILSTLPADFVGKSAAAHIAINRRGTRLYVSNRGHDSIAVFALSAHGDITPIQHVACGGHWPRMFLLREDAGELLVANEHSGDIGQLVVRPDGRLGAATPIASVPGIAFLAT